MSRPLCRGVAKLVKASDFDSDMRGFESFLPCQTSEHVEATAATFKRRSGNSLDDC